MKMPGLRSLSGRNEGRFDFLGTKRLVLGRSNAFLGSKTLFYGFSKILFSGIFFFSTIGLFCTGFFFSVDYLNGFRSRDRDDIKVDLL